MSKLSIGAIEDQARRDLIALLVASAWLQLGDARYAQRFFQAARSWGCDKKQIVDIMSAGIHNSLARAHTIAGNSERALAHFEHSVVGIPGDMSAACEARINRERSRLAQLPGVGRGWPAAFAPSPRQAAGRSSLVVGGTDRDSGSSGRDNTAVSLPALDERPTVLVAGMRHSGSTALFNILRIIIESEGLPHIAAYSETRKCIDEVLLSDASAFRLIKTHEMRDDLLSRADLVFTTRRDLRDTVASASRRDFAQLRRIGSAVEYAKYNRTLHEIWLPHSHYEFHYERFMRAPFEVIREVQGMLGLKGKDARSIYDDVASLPTDSYDTTLLSPTHITDPNRSLSFADSLNEVDVAAIEAHAFHWLERYAYL